MLEALCLVIALISVLSEADRPVSAGLWHRIIASHISLQHLAVAGIGFSVWGFLVRMAGLHRAEPNGLFGETVRVALVSLGVAESLQVFSPMLNDSLHGSAGPALFLLCFGSMMALRLGTALLTGSAWCLFHGNRSVLIVGTGIEGRRAYRELRTQRHRCHRLLGFADLAEECSYGGEVAALYLGSVHNLERILLESVVDEVIIALPVQSCYQEIVDVIETCRRCGVEVRYPNDILASAGGRQASASLISLKPTSQDSRQFIKRCVDIAVSLIGLIVLLPLMIAAAIAVRATSSGPAIFRQERYGLGRRRFTMYKFRTMVQDAEARMAALESQNEVSGPIFKMRRDPRVTRIGAFLRRTSIDELPQLFNVLMGSMSLVGPRPMSVRDVSRFDQAWLMRRFSVKPGLTCLWQVGGRSSTTFARWMNLDMQYIDTWSLSLDFKILVRTVPAVMRGSGAM
jgi:exopolysaccharide biosynthesis polyprenyl glycosylphosphotransferase